MQQRKKEREDDEKSRMLRKEIEELKALLNQKKMEYDVHRKSKEACLSTASSQISRARTLTSGTKNLSAEELLKSNDVERMTLFKKLELFDARRFNFVQTSKKDWVRNEPQLPQRNQKSKQKLSDLLELAGQKKDPDSLKRDDRSQEKIEGTSLKQPSSPFQRNRNLKSFKSTGQSDSLVSLDLEVPAKRTRAKKISEIQVYGDDGYAFTPPTQQFKRDFPEKKRERDKKKKNVQEEESDESDESEDEEELLRQSFLKNDKEEPGYNSMYAFQGTDRRGGIELDEKGGGKGVGKGGGKGGGGGGGGGKIIKREGKNDEGRKTSPKERNKEARGIPLSASAGFRDESEGNGLYVDQSGGGIQERKSLIRDDGYSGEQKLSKEGGSKGKKKPKKKKKKKVEEEAHKWNIRFQTCLKKMEELDDCSELKDRVEVVTQLMHLSEDFVYASRAVGKMIISEVCLSIDEKVIKPITKCLGGRAGGEKYMVHNILFKFALDSFKLFGGSDLAAAKVAGHELKGLMAYSSLHLLGVNTPLMTLVDYRGFRLVAICVLPVNNRTLIYGTNNAGKDVYNKDPNFSDIMESAARTLNVKKHVCGRSRPVELAAAADIEGHRGTDGKYYLLDFSRTMPPVKPDTTRFQNPHLYNLFRKEFVSKFRKPLCSDAYSGFILKDELMMEHNREIDEATHYLLSLLVPELAVELYEHFSENRETFKLEQLFHHTGVNLRYIGDVIKVLDDPKQFRELKKEYAQETVRQLVFVLINEAIARVIKNELNRQLREKVYDLRLPQEVPYRKLTVEYLNLIFGNSDEHRTWWQSTLPPLLSLYFNISSNPSLLNATDLRQAIFLSSEKNIRRDSLFRRVTQLTALRFSEESTQKISMGCGATHDPVVMLDLIEIGDRVKPMDIVSLYQGNFYLFKSLAAGGVSAEIGMLSQAIEKYNQALNSSINKETLRNLSVAHYRLLCLLSSQGNSGKLFLVEEAMKNMIQADKKDSMNLCLYALYLIQRDNLVKAEKYFIRALDENPRNGFALVEYYKFLNRVKLFTASELLPSLMLKMIDAPIVSPVDGSQLGGVIKVYGEDGSFKSLNVVATFTTLDVCQALMTAMKVSFEPMKSHLYLVKQERDVSAKESKFKQRLDPAMYPWILLQGRGGSHILYYESRPSPMDRSSLSPLLFQGFPKIDEIILSVDGLLSAVVGGVGDEFTQRILYQTFFFVFPLFLEKKEEVVEFLFRSMNQTWYISLTSEWVANFGMFPELEITDIVQMFSSCSSFGSNRPPPDFDLLTQIRKEHSAEIEVVLELREFFLSCFSSGEDSGRGEREKEEEKEEEDPGLISSSGGSGGDWNKKWKEKKKGKRRQIFLDGSGSRGSGSGSGSGLRRGDRQVGLGTSSSLSLSSSPFDFFLLRSFKRANVPTLATHLRTWVLSLAFHIYPRDFMWYFVKNRKEEEDDEENIGCGAIAALKEYEKGIGEWVLSEVADTVSSPSQTLLSFSYFSELAQRSYKLGDLSTCLAIMTAMNSEKVNKMQKTWRSLPSHVAVTAEFRNSPPSRLLCSLTSSSDLLSKYQKCLNSFRSKGLIYVGNVTRLCDMLEMIGGVVEKEREKGEGGEKEKVSFGGNWLDLRKTFAVVNCVMRYSFDLKRGKGDLCHMSLPSLKRKETEEEEGDGKKAKGGKREEEKGEEKEEERELFVWLGDGPLKEARREMLYFFNSFSFSSSPALYHKKVLSFNFSSSPALLASQGKFDKKRVKSLSLSLRHIKSGI